MSADSSDARAAVPKRRGRPPRGPERSVVLTVRLTADEIAAVRERSERDRVSVSDVVRRALAEWLPSDTVTRPARSRARGAAGRAEPGDVEPRSRERTLEG